MGTFLPTWPVLLTFLAASFVLAVTPGPGVFYIVTRSLAQGRATGLVSVAGVAFGNLGNAIGASVGLAAVMAVSSLAFMIVKYAGAAYLIYLGVRAIRSSRTEERYEVGLRKHVASRVFLDGVLVALLNPKTALFFGAFLPQFLNADTTSLAQTVALGSLFVAVAATTDSVYALSAATIAGRFGRGVRTHVSAYVTGGALIGLGLVAAFSGARDGVRR
jgi:threonine/homoserine/homoserine lactone efflux protein